MRFHSTNNKLKHYSLPKVLRLGLAPDGGLFMPDSWPKQSREFLKRLKGLNFQQVAFVVTSKFFTEVSPAQLHAIVAEAFNFPVPLKQIGEGLYILELFHGPTMAFKDFGARFLSRTLDHFLKIDKRRLNIIVATSGDTGSAVASGFYKNSRIKVFVLYPSGKVSPLQEKQLTTYGRNVTALEVKGTFDDCQKLAKQVLSDKSLNEVMPFSSANSINFGRLLPQAVYYFWACAQLQEAGVKKQPVIVVPSGNFGNLFAGLIAKQIGLPAYKFIAATNNNNVVPKYLKTGKFQPTRSKRTISNAMDVGNPSNFARMLELYKGNCRSMAADILAKSVTDAKTKQTIQNIYSRAGYVLDPHTAVGVAAALSYRPQFLRRHPLVVLGTAHPAKFREIVEPVINKRVLLPRQLKRAMAKKKQSVIVNNSYRELVATLLKFQQ